MSSKWAMVMPRASATGDNQSSSHQLKLLQLCLWNIVHLTGLRAKRPSPRMVIVTQMVVSVNLITSPLPPCSDVRLAHSVSEDDGGSTLYWMDAALLETFPFKFFQWLLDALDSPESAELCQQTIAILGKDPLKVILATVTKKSFGFQFIVGCLSLPSADGNAAKPTNTKQPEGWANGTGYGPRTSQLLTGLADSMSTKAATRNPHPAARCYMVVAQPTRKSLRLAAVIIKGMTFYTTLTLEAVRVLVVLGNGPNGTSTQLAARTSCIINPSSANWKKSAKIPLFKDWEQLTPANEALAGSPFVSQLVQSFLVELVANAVPTVEYAQGLQIEKFFSKLVNQARFEGRNTAAIVRSFVIGYLAPLNRPIMVQNPESLKKLQKLVKNFLLDQLERQYRVQSERFLHLTTSDDGKKNGQVGSGGDTRKEEVRGLAIDSLVKALKKNKVRNMNFPVLTLVEKLAEKDMTEGSTLFGLEESPTTTRQLCYFKLHLSSFISSPLVSTAFCPLLRTTKLNQQPIQSFLRQAVNDTLVLDALLIDQVVEVRQSKGEVDVKPVFNHSRSNVFTFLLKRFNVDKATLVSIEGWSSFQKSLRCFFMAADDFSGHALIIPPQDILSDVISKVCFRAVVSLSVQLFILGELLDITNLTDRTATGARKAFERISCDATWLTLLVDVKSAAATTLAQQLESFPGREPRSGVKAVRPPKATGRRQRMSMAALPKLNHTPVCYRILFILETLQAKKGLGKVQPLIAPLFELLESCLSEEEQAPVEYLEQLILSSLLSCSPNLLDGESAKLAGEFDTGLIVECFRLSAYPQTYHQALLLLSFASKLFSSHVVHSIMAIFVLMRTSVLRQDAYSFIVITKALESVVPVVIEASNRTAVDPVVTTVVHVSADSLSKVPEHRRLPVFDKLLSTLDPQLYLWLIPTLILSNMASKGPRLGRGHLKEDVDAPIIFDTTLPNVSSAPNRKCVVADVFSLSTLYLYKPQVQLTAYIQMLEYLKLLSHAEDGCSRSTSISRAGEKGMTEESAPFAIEGCVATIQQLCYLMPHLSSFISSLLASSKLIEQLVELYDIETPNLKPLYRDLVQVALEGTQIVSIMADVPLSSRALLSASETGASSSPEPLFWKTLLNLCYDFINRVNSHLLRFMFLSVVPHLLSLKILYIRRHSMEFLSAKLQHQSGFSLSEDEEALLQLIPGLTNIARGLQDVIKPTEEVIHNQQTALYTLKSLRRFMGPSYSASFCSVLDAVVGIMCQPINSNRSAKGTAPPHVLTSAFLCLAGLISTMGVQSLPSLPCYRAQLVARLEDDVAVLERNDLLLISIGTALAKLVETLPQSLLFYLPSTIKQVCHLSIKQPTSSTGKPSLIQYRLQSINHYLAAPAVIRSLVCSITQIFGEVTTGLVDSSADRPCSFISSLSIGSLMSILQKGFAATSQEELLMIIQLPSLTAFFLIKALDVRSLISCSKPLNQETKSKEYHIGRIADVGAAEESLFTSLSPVILFLAINLEDDVDEVEAVARSSIGHTEEMLRAFSLILKTFIFILRVLINYLEETIR